MLLCPACGVLHNDDPAYVRCEYCRVGAPIERALEGRTNKLGEMKLGFSVWDNGAELFPKTPRTRAPLVLPDPLVQRAIDFHRDFPLTATKGHAPMNHAFTCPTCGCHEYGSSGCTGPAEGMTGHCHGYIRQSDGSSMMCSYSWPRAKDAELHPGLKQPSTPVTGEGRVG